MQTPEPPGPVIARPVARLIGATLAPQSHRIGLIDAVRGLALLGIFLVNMPYHNGSAYSTQTPTMSWPSPVDRAAEFAVRALAESKFYTMFSFLFGMGLVLQRERLLGSGGEFGGVYARRLLVLAALGACHIAFVWVGDILLTYALLGFPLLLFSHRRDKTLLTWAVLLAILYSLVVTGLTALPLVGQMFPGTASQAAAEIAKFADIARADAERAIREYSTGTYVACMRQRLREWTEIAYYIGAMTPSIFSMFLLGMFAGRAGWLRDPRSHARLWRRLLSIALPIGLILSVAGAALLQDQNLARPTWRMTAGSALSTSGAPLLCLGYVALFVTIWLRHEGGILRSLAAPGRMALTNYLMQSLICALLFQGYGLAWYGRTSPAMGVLIVLAIYSGQVLLSQWWLARFRFGPAEWLWRSLTYGRLQPMRPVVEAAQRTRREAM